MWGGAVGGVGWSVTQTVQASADTRHQHTVVCVTAGTAGSVKTSFRASPPVAHQSSVFTQSAPASFVTPGTMTLSSSSMYATPAHMFSSSTRSSSADQQQEGKACSKHGKHGKQYQQFTTLIWLVAAAAAAVADAAAAAAATTAAAAAAVR